MDKAKNAISKMLVAKLFENDFLQGLDIIRQEGPELIYARVAELVNLLENTPDSNNPYHCLDLEGLPILIDRVVSATMIQPIYPAQARKHIGVSDSELRKWLLILLLEGFNGDQPLRIDAKGRIMDGLKRLKAAILLGADIRIVVYDMDADKLL